MRVEFAKETVRIGVRADARIRLRVDVAIDPYDYAVAGEAQTVAGFLGKQMES